jgi:hypothetical protein
MPLKDDLEAITLAALDEEKTEGGADAASKLSDVTAACTARAELGLRTVTFPEPTKAAQFLTRGTALSLQATLEAEGLSVRVIPYKDVNFYLDINW